MKPKKPYTRMNAEELADATKGLDQLSFEDTRPLSGANREWWERSKRRANGSKGGKQSRAVLITVEGGLLARADRLAERAGLSRSELFARGLRALLAAGSGAAGPKRASR